MREWEREWESERVRERERKRERDFNLESMKKSYLLKQMSDFDLRVEDLKSGGSEVQTLTNGKSNKQNVCATLPCVNKYHIKWCRMKRWNDMFQWTNQTLKSTNVTILQNYEKTVHVMGLKKGF